MAVPPKDKDKHKQQAVEQKEGEKKAVKAGDDSKGQSLHKAIYVSDLDKIAVVEERSDTIQFLNARNGERGCKDLDCGMDAAKIAGKGQGFNYSQFKKKIIVMAMSKELLLLMWVGVVYLKLEDYSNLLLVASDDSVIRAFYYNGN